jgi:hypothetical protein
VQYCRYINQCQLTMMLFRIRKRFGQTLDLYLYLFIRNIKKPKFLFAYFFTLLLLTKSKGRKKCPSTFIVKY